MEIQEYLQEKKEFYKILIEFLDNDDENEAILNKKKLFEILSNQERINNKDEFELLLRLIIKISKNHHRKQNFNNKIEQIILHIKNEIKQSFTNSEIFNIFQGSKLILLYAIENNIIIIDESIARNIFKKRSNYIQFFLPEIKPFVRPEKVKQIENELLKMDENIFSNFSEKRKNGENESYICQLIREDSIEEFVKYVNKNSISLTKTVEPSIFETNSYLIKNQPTLIEYSAFYGSIQIFQFLKLNNVQFTNRLMFYSIHGRNPEIIHILEECKINQNYDKYSEYLEESIKCHHNEFADYFKNNFIIETQNFNTSIISYCFHYNNYEYLPIDLNDINMLIFFYSCQYDYFELVKIFVKTMKIDINMKIIFNFSFINRVFNLICYSYNS